MPWPNHLRAELARRELEKSSIITSIAAPGITASRIQQAIGRYVELDRQVRNILSQLRLTENQLVPLIPPASGSLRCNHRLNGDGSYDSICPFCFSTIANARCESDLDEIERDHTCDPAALRRYYSRPS